MPGCRTPLAPIDVTGDSLNGAGHLVLTLSNGQTVDTGSVQGGSAPVLNPRLIGEQKWYGGRTDGWSFALGNNPVGLCFDGTYVWACRQLAPGVYRVNAADGTVGGPYAAGNNSWGICYDGQYVWVVNADDDTLTKV